MIKSMNIYILDIKYQYQLLSIIIKMFFLLQFVYIMYIMHMYFMVRLSYIKMKLLKNYIDVHVNYRNLQLFVSLSFLNNFYC